MVADDITAPMRAMWLEAAYGGRVPDYLRAQFGVDKDWEAVYQADRNPPKMATLVMCRWCTSMWLAFGVLAVRRTRAWGLLADALVMSEAAALAEQLEG